MEEIHNAPSVWTLTEQLVMKRRSSNEPETTSLLECLPQWIVGPDRRRQVSTGDIWTVLLVAFGVADLLVILSSAGGLHLLDLG